MRILVLGYLVRGPIGGMAWHHLQYVLGLNRLGHDVYFLEDSDDYPSCYDPSRGVTDADPSYGLKFAEEAFRRLGLPDRWAYHDAHTRRWLGPCAGRAGELCGTADLLLNVSGVNPIRPWLSGVPARVLIDTDPVFTQIRHLKDPNARERAGQHTAFFTFGENLALGADSNAPSDGLPWQPTRQPIVLDEWPLTPGPVEGAWTTVMQWDSYPAQEFGGMRYGMKADSFALFLDAPARTGRRFELALGSANAPRAELATRGWRIRDPLEVTRDPWTYQRYIQQSKGEFSVAKQGYAASGCGWFSERSGCYLASGRPVITQETGFSKFLPTGKGLFPFRTMEDILAAVDAIESDYEGNCRAAREIAVEYFSAEKVLRSLLERALVPTSPASSRPAASRSR